MNNRRIFLLVVPILILFSALLWLSSDIKNRYATVESSFTPTIESQSNADGEIGPIIVTRVEEQPNDVIFIAKDLVGGQEFPRIELPAKSWAIDQPVLADSNIFAAFGDNINSIMLYKISPARSPSSIQLADEDFGTGIFWSKYLIVIPPKAKTIQLIKPDFGQFQIPINVEYLNDGIHNVINVFTGKEGKLIAFSYVPLYENNEYSVLVWVIDPETSSIEERKLPFLKGNIVNRDASPKKDQRNNVMILAINQDFTKIVYSYFYSKDSDPGSMYPAYAVYSTTEKNDLVIVKDRFFLPKFDQTRDIIYQEKYRFNGSGGVILNLSDLSPVVDIDQFIPRTADSRTHICPYGSNWLVGSDTEVFVVSSAGKVVEKYSLPSDFVGKEYQFVRPVTE